MTARVLDLTTGPLLAALRTADPTRWRRTVRAALKAHGTLSGAAEALGVERKTLRRWVAQDDAVADGIALAGPGRPAKGG